MVRRERTTLGEVSAKTRAVLLDQIRTGNVGAVEDKDEEYSVDRAAAKRLAVELERERQYNALKKDWSENVILWITFIIVNHTVLIYTLGLGVLDLSRYAWLVPSLILKDLIEIMGLAFIMVRHLYPLKRGDFGNSQ